MGESITAYLTQWASGEKTTGTKYVWAPFISIDHKFSNNMNHDKIVLHLFKERNLSCKTGFISKGSISNLRNYNIPHKLDIIEESADVLKQAKMIGWPLGSSELLGNVMERRR